MRVKKLLSSIPEILLFLVLLLSVFSFSEYNKKEILCIFSLAAFLVFFMIRMRNSPNIKAGYLTITVLFIILFNITDSAGASSFHEANAGKLGTIPLTTLLLVMAFLSYLIKSVARGRFQLYTGSFFTCLAASCAFIILLTVLFYPLLRSLYPISIQPELQLLNRISKFFMLAVLVGDYVSNEINFRRMSWGFLFTMGLIIILNAVL